MKPIIGYRIYFTEAARPWDNGNRPNYLELLNADAGGKVYYEVLYGMARLSVDLPDGTSKSKLEVPLTSISMVLAMEEGQK